MPSISGHMIVKNGVEYDYPFIESCLSILPICDEFIFLEGFGEDETFEKLCELQKEHPKIRIHRMEWKSEHYSVLSDMTNHCIELSQCDYHFQIQADEVVHEKYHDKIKELTETGMDCFMFSVSHFFSSFDKIYQPGVFYDRFVRMAKRDKYPGILSYGDAMSLGCPNTDPNQFKHFDAQESVQVYHYGYVRKPSALIQKQIQMTRWWGYHDLDPYLQNGLDSGMIKWNDKHPEEQLRSFEGTHPAVLHEWAKERDFLVSEGKVE